MEGQKKKENVELMKYATALFSLKSDRKKKNYYNIALFFFSMQYGKKS
jgi:hypothetical protein